MISIIIVQISLYLYSPSGYYAYIFPSLCWLFIAFIAILSCNFKEILLSFNRIILIIAFLASLFQIISEIDGGLFTKYGRSPVVLTPMNIILNLMMISTSLIGTEFSRSCILKTYGKKNPVIFFVITSIIYSQTLALINMIYTPSKPLLIIEFIGSKYLPAFAMNMLASYLAIISGPLASIAYLAPLKIFQWFSPILPNLSWGFESLIGVLAPTISLIVIDHAIPESLLRSAGFKIEYKSKWSKDSSFGIILTSMLSILIVWLGTGLLGIYPSIVMSGSMRPTIDVGDIALIIKVPTNKIKSGDIIQYFTRNGMILHRVIEIKNGLFVTKGDANSMVDFKPIHPSQIRGKLLLVIPKIGWISIYMKRIIFFLSNNFTYINFDLLISLIIIASFTSSYLFHIKSSRKRRYGRWK